MKKSVTTDVAIFGGGIAGLWLLHRLRQSGLSAILFESAALGGGQTHKSQGIIHGGMKYALQGVLTKEAEAMSDMPAYWKQCLAGAGTIDLSNVPILSHQQYLWSPHKLTSKLTGLLASASLSSTVAKLPRAKYPTVLQHPAFKGEVRSLDEIVIDVPVLIRELVKANQDAIFKIEPIDQEALMLNAQEQLQSVTVCAGDQSVNVNAQQFIFTAGAGNEVIIKKLKRDDVAMQRRPLHMVLVKTPLRYSLYAHCLGLSSKPRLTITTHKAQDGSTIWYLGGQLAEEGVGRTSAAQIQAARVELDVLFPWLDFTTADFATFAIDRAEPLQKSGLKPDTSYSKVIQNMMVAWPTKLAFAPKLAEEIMQHLQTARVSPRPFDLRELYSWPLPPLAQAIWETLFCKSVA